MERGRTRLTAVPREKEERGMAKTKFSKKTGNPLRGEQNRLMRPSIQERLFLVGGTGEKRR